MGPVLYQTLKDARRAIKSFCGGSRGAVFSKSAPLAAGGNKSVYTG
jgi:hypothetical protein